MIIKNLVYDNIQDILDYFDKVAHFKLLKVNENSFIVEDKVDKESFEISKKEWYSKIQEWFIEENLLDKDIMRELNYHDVFKICLRVAKLEKYIKMEGGK